MHIATEINFNLRRELEERRAICCAVNPAVRAAHSQLAKLYALRAASLTAAESESHSDPARRAA